MPIPCASWLSIRVVDPADPTAPYLSQCEQVPLDNKKDLCSIRSIELDATKQLPLKNLEVQVALFPGNMITTDPMTGDPICPADTQYDAANGFPIASDQTPALGGRGFYHSGDSTILVTLGCTDLHSVNGETCGGGGDIPVTAAVNDFDSGVGFTGQMTVSVGEPAVSDAFYVLGSPQLHPLERGAGQQWTGSVSQPFGSFACLAVLEDAPQSTTTLACRRATNGDTIFQWPTAANSTDVAEKRVGAGVRLSKAALDQLLIGLSLSSFPTHGLTIGIVLDKNGDPVANQEVTATPPPNATATIQYFAGDRGSIGGTRTTTSGVWASTDAPFGTTFSATGGSPPSPITRIGGMIDGKVTIVVLQFGTGGVGGSI